MQKLWLLLVLASLTLMAACGGGGSGSSTITSVSVTCSPSTILYGQTSQCSATVTGTGNFSSGVTWTASAGTISSSGLFTAPSGGATSLQVTITATSTQDTSKSGTATVTVNPTQQTNNVQPIVVDAGPEPQTFITLTWLHYRHGLRARYDHLSEHRPRYGGHRLFWLAPHIFGCLEYRAAAGKRPQQKSACDECLVFSGWLYLGTGRNGRRHYGRRNGFISAGTGHHPIIELTGGPQSCSSQNPAGGDWQRGRQPNSNSVSTFGANGIIGVGLFQQDCGGFCVYQLEQQQSECLL